jgi:hypothetical protein
VREGDAGVRGGRVLLVSVLFAGGAVCARPQTDSFRAGTTRVCNKTTGYFHVEKTGGRWSLCTPEGHTFFIVGVDAVFPSQSAGSDGKSFYQKAVAKYGDADAYWAEAAARRIQHWGFNALGTYASPYVEPTYLDNKYPEDGHGLHSHPTKLPFITIVRPAYYAMKNEGGYLPEPVKNLMYGASPYYTGYDPPIGIADYFDSKLDAWLGAALATESYWTELRKSPYLNYLIGIACEDGDQTYGFGAGDQFPTIPSRGFNNPHLGWIVATMAPSQTANASKRVLYADTAVYTKLAWRDGLKAKYGTIDALNAAWGSNYTTFDSAGTQVRNEYVGTGDGRTATFSHRFSLLLPTRFSVQFKLDSKIIAGDTNRYHEASQNVRERGQIFGPETEGYIDYSRGAVVLTFATAPPLGARITVDYVQNGWGIGSGLLDEDGRPEHQKWLGSDFTSLSDSSTPIRSDLGSLLRAVSGHFFRTCRTGIKAAFPNTLYLGPDTLGSYGVPPRPEVLQSAAEYLDVLLLSGTGGFSRKVLDYIARYGGDKPIIETNFRAANSDSEFASYPMGSGVPGFASQVDRGRDYEEALANVRQATTSAGFHPYVGLLWWQYADNWDEKLNWGLVTLRDNAYDGHEDVRQNLNCSAPLQNLQCGGEDHNYGDLISAVQQANLGQPQQLTGGQHSFSFGALTILLSVAAAVARTYLVRDGAPPRQ